MRLVTFSLVCGMFFTLSHASESIPYKNPSLPVKVRVADLLSRMTLNEKLLQLSQLTLSDNNVNNISANGKDGIPLGIGSLIYFSSDPEARNKVQKENMLNTRLGIPVLFGFDVIHGYNSIYPIPLAQSCSWNPELATKLSRIAAYEAYNTGINWTFSPMIDVSRDPRWGRVAECYGEDPYLNGIFGVAAVKGYQGQDLLDKYSIAACLKHYVGYGASEGGRDYRYTEVSEQTLWSTYLPPYKACVEQGACTVMSAFNDISGVPATCNEYTLNHILRDRWKFDGFVVSDWNAIEQLVYQGVAENDAEAGLKAFKAGVDMDMVDMIYFDNFNKLLNEGKLDISLIDKSVERILSLKFRLGLFENPYTVPEKDTKIEKSIRKNCEQMAEESFVLLKNDKTLPIDNKVKSLAVIGPMAKDKENLLGSWSANGKPENAESIFEGLSSEFGKRIKLNYALGSNFEETNQEMIKEAIDVVSKSDAVILCLGEKRTWSGENASRSTISLPTAQEDLMSALYKEGKPIVLILSSGRPIELSRLEPMANSIIEIWQPGLYGAIPLAGILSGRINPSGKLTMTFPLISGQIPVYYNMRQSARPYKKMGDYLDITVNPLYEFGHGLSYTEYEYSEISVSKTKISRNEEIKAEITVTNIGSRSGKETVLWFISDPACTISRPIKELKFFEKKEIQPGESKVYTFIINPERDLSYVDSDGNPLLEKGLYYLRVKDKCIKIEVID